MIGPEDLAKLARNLNTPTADETRLRCAISRAYYAAFHFCNSAANLFCNGLAPGEDTGKGVHSQLYLRMELHSKDKNVDVELRTMAEEAKKLRNLRKIADYGVNETIDTKQVLISFSLMEHVRQGFTRLQTQINKSPQ